MEPNKTGVSEQVFLEVLHSEYRRIDSEYREKTSCYKFFFAPFSDQIPVSWAIDSLSMTWKRMFEYVPPPVLIPQVLETSEETMCAGVDCSTLSETMMLPNSTRTQENFTEDADTKECNIRHTNPESLNLENGNFKSDSRKKKFSSKAQDYIKQARRT